MQKTFPIGASNWAVSDVNSNILVDRCNQAGWASYAVQLTGTSPDTTAEIFAKGCQLILLANGVPYYNTAADGLTATWVTPPASSLALPDSVTDSTTTTGTSLALIMSSLTTGVGQVITAAAATTAVIYKAVAAALTTGAIFEAIATAATLTTGRYFKANDGTIDVWGIGANGHIHTAQTTAPTVGTVTAQGITAAAITAGSGDVSGEITTTGTQNNVSASVIPIVFNKTYTAAPKSIQLTALNASGANGTSLPYISAISATGFSISVTPSATAGATPSWSYQVIA